MIRPLPTASRLDTSERCPGSMVLDGVSVTTDDNRDGTTIHDFALVRSREIGREAALAEVPREVRDRCAAIDLSAIPPGARSEVALAWNWRTGEARIVGENIGRNYPRLGPEWFQGTIDIIGQSSDAVIVQDIKTGEQKVPAAESLQLGFAALVGSIVAGKERAEVAMLYLGQTGRWFFDRATLDEVDLGAVAGRLIAIAEAKARAEAQREAGELPSLHVGPWCSLCSSARFCPAQTAIVRVVAGWDVATVAERMSELSDGDAGEAWERMALVEKIVEQGRKALRERARVRPIPLPSGKWLAEVEWGTRDHESDAAKAQIEEVREGLRASGEIAKVPAMQVRAVSAKKAGVAA